MTLSIISKLHCLVKPSLPTFKRRESKGYFLNFQFFFQMSKDKNTGLGASETGGDESASPTVLRVGEISGGDLALLKAQYPGLRPVAVKVSQEEISVGYYKRPNRVVTGLALNELYKKNIVEAGTIVLNNCFVGGDDRQKTDDMMSISIANRLVDFLELMEVTVLDA